MKKFFSLVLALVMALSLTTVAWGAPVDAPAPDANGVITLVAGTEYNKINLTGRSDVKEIIGNGAEVAGIYIDAGDLDNLYVENVVLTDLFHFEDGAVSNVAIVGCTFSGDARLALGMGTGSVSDVTVWDCTFNNMTYGAGAILGNTSGYITFTGNTFDGSTKHAISLSGTVGGNIMIEENEFTDIAEAAIRVDDTASDVVLAVQNNVAENVTYAIKAEDEPATIENWNNEWDDGELLVAGAESAALADIGSGVTTDASGKFTAGSFVAAPAAADIADGYEAVYTAGAYMVIAKTSAAGTTSTLKDKDGYDIYTLTGTTSVKATKADITKKVTSNVSVTVDGKTTTTYTATTYSDGANVYVEVDASIATHKLMMGNSIVAYMVNLADLGYVPTTTKVATAFVEAKKTADQVCGDYTVNGYVVDGKTYIAGGANWAVLNGKFVQYTETLVPTVAHDYAAGSYSVKDKTVATVKCVDCKATWTVLTEKQVKTMAPSAYTKLTTGTAEVIGLYIPAAATPAAGTTTGTVVESAQTFDAGIAMYVGMSVMAAAGSAVVIGKKKD